MQVGIKGGYTAKNVLIGEDFAKYRKAEQKGTGGHRTPNHSHAILFISTRMASWQQTTELRTRLLTTAPPSPCHKPQPLFSNIHPTPHLIPLEYNRQSEHFPVSPRPRTGVCSAHVHCVFHLWTHVNGRSLPAPYFLTKFCRPRFLKQSVSFYILLTQSP